MSRYVAFLRAINVGGHTVKMEQLRQSFEALGFSSVETFIASGNVVFETKAKDPRAIETKIEKALKEALGYVVTTFIRTDTDVAAIANYRPFTKSELDASAAFNIGFLAEPFDDISKQKLMALRTDIDQFHVHGREIYWLCRKKQSQSTFSNALLEKTTGKRSTWRGADTIRRIAAKYAPPPGRVPT